MMHNKPGSRVQTAARAFCWLAAALACAALWGCAATGPQPRSYEELRFEQDLTWQEPEVRTFAMDNGVRFFLVQDRELPLVTVEVLARGGEFAEPEGLEGLARITAEAMRNGGSRKHPAQELNRLLENNAAQMDISFDFISGSAKLNVLSRDLDDALPVFTDVLAHPAFPEDKVMLAKQHLRTSIARRNDNQGEIAFREFKQLLYGEDSLYARVPQYATVKAIDREDLRRFHSRTFRGPNLLVGVVGDFDPDRIEGKLRRAFSVFPGGGGRSIDLPRMGDPFEPGIHVADKPDVNQSFILMGHLGDRRQNPDYAALQVMDKILSGGFSGRLFQTIRSEKGLAYAVFGRFGCEYYYPGMFFVGLKTKTGQTALAIREVRSVLRRLKEEGVSRKELERAKDQFFNSLVFRFDKPEEILGRRMHYEYRNMPADSFDRLIEDVREVTVQDVQRVAREYIRMERMETLVVGQGDELRPQLKKLAPVKEVDITIPK